MTVLIKPIYLKARYSDSSSKLTGLLTGLLLGAISLYAPISNAAPIYKVVDEQTGQVTFTDRPQNYEQQEDKWVSQTSITTTHNTSQSSFNDSTSDQSDNGQYANDERANVKSANSTGGDGATKVNYQLSIVEPSEERAYHRPAQSITVNLQLQPALRSGDKVIIYLNGNEVAQGLSASIATLDLVPGQYSIQAVVKDKKGQTLQQAERMVFVIQNTVLMQNKRKAAAQMQAYQNLPWYQKAWLAVRQNDSVKSQPSITPIKTE